MTDVDPFVQAEEGSGQRKQTLVDSVICRLTETIQASLRNLASLASVSGLENIFTFGVP